MIWEDFDIELNNFAPTDIARVHISHISEVIRDLSPSDAYIKITVSKARKFFLGTVQITSSQFKLLINKRGRTLQQTLEQLLESVKIEIVAWHKSLQPLQQSFFNSAA